MSNIWPHVSTVPTLMPASVSTVTINPAMIIPVAMSGIAFRAGIPKAHDAKEPVQAPVIGNGIATRTTRNIGPYLAKCLVWELRSNLARQSKFLLERWDIYGAKSHQRVDMELVITQGGGCPI